MRKIHFCFKLLKDKYWQHSQQSTSTSTSTVISDGNLDIHRLGVESNLLNLDINRLRELVKQRDDEINVLVTMLKQEKQQSSESEKSLFLLREKYIQDTGSSIDLKLITTTNMTDENRSSISRDSALSSLENSTSYQLREEVSKAKLAKLSKARQEAFDSFRGRHQQYSVIEKQKETMREKFSEAKELGKIVNSTRLQMNALKGKLQKAAVAMALGTEQVSREACMEEELLRQQLEDNKNKFKDSCSVLRQLKEEIEHLQHLLEKTKVQLQKEFEEWWLNQVRINRKKLFEPDSERSTPTFGDRLHSDTLGLLETNINSQSTEVMNEPNHGQINNTINDKKINVVPNNDPIPYGITNSKACYLTCAPQNSSNVTHRINLASKENTIVSNVPNYQSNHNNYSKYDNINTTIPNNVLKISDKEVQEDIQQFYRTKQQILTKYKL